MAAGEADTLLQEVSDDFRKVVLNALLWIAKTDVPADGVASTVTPEDLKSNLDPKKK